MLKEVVVAELHIMYRYWPVANDAYMEVSVRSPVFVLKLENATYETQLERSSVSEDSAGCRNFV
jgi:hypothetical protein